MRKPLLFTLALLPILLAAGGALAQDIEVQGLLDRIGRLERDVNLLQRQVYVERRGNNAFPPGPAAAPPVAQAAAAAEVRDQRIDEQMRELTGRIEEVRHGLDQVRNQVDKFSDDVDQRLQALEKNQVAAATPPSPNTSPPPDQHTLKTPSARNTPTASPNRPPHGDPPAAEQNVAVTPPDLKGGNLPNGTPQQQYDAAFKLLREANYPAAESALKEFMQRYPGDPLAGNAQYWLGETYYVGGKFDAAAAAFAEGYQKFPKGAKAPDSLLKLGASLVKLGRKADACAAFSRLDRDFPIAAPNIKAREAAERHDAGC